MAPKNSTVFSEPAMTRLLAKAAYSLPVSPNMFMIPKWRLLLAPFCLLTFRIVFCEEVATESFFGTCGDLEQIYPCKSFKTTDFNC